MGKKKGCLIFIVGFFLVGIIANIIAPGETKNSSTESKEIVNKEEIDLKEFIKVNVVDSRGDSIELDKGVLKDKLELKHNYLVEVKNISQEYEFEGTVTFDNVDLMDNYGTLKIGPGQSTYLEMKFNNNNATYTISGKMKKVIDYGNEYKVLGSKVRGQNKENVFIGIEKPDDLNAKKIAKYFKDSYKNENLDSLTVYIYEKGYTLKDTSAMSKDAIYDVSVYKEKGEYKYYLYKDPEGKCIEEGVLK